MYIKAHATHMVINIHITHGNYMNAKGKKKKTKHISYKRAQVFLFEMTDVSKVLIQSTLKAATSFVTHFKGMEVRNYLFLLVWIRC